MYKKGDWFYHEFKLFQAKEDSAPKKRFDISDGYIETSAFEEECVPLTATNKVLSEAVESIYDDVRKLGNGLNYPAIHYFFETEWLFMCTVASETQVNSTLEGLRDMAKKIRDIVYFSKVNDIPIFREGK